MFKSSFQFTIASWSTCLQADRLQILPVSFWKSPFHLNSIFILFPEVCSVLLCISNGGIVSYWCGVKAAGMRCVQVWMITRSLNLIYWTMKVIVQSGPLVEMFDKADIISLLHILEWIKIETDLRHSIDCVYFPHSIFRWGTLKFAYPFTNLQFEYIYIYIFNIASCTRWGLRCINWRHGKANSCGFLEAWQPWYLCLSEVTSPAKNCQ